METVKKYLKILGYLLVGVMISQFILTPYLQGDFDDEIYSINSFFGQGDEFDEVLEEEKLKRIEQNIHRYIFDEFHREFGSDAILKYEEFMRREYANPDDVFLFNYSKHELDNRSRQLNPNNDEYWRSRGYDEKPTGQEYRVYDYSKDEIDNRSDQLNPNNDSYWQSRGHEERPDNWEEE